MIGFTNVIKYYKNMYNPYFFYEGVFLTKELGDIVVKMK